MTNPLTHSELTHHARVTVDLLDCAMQITLQPGNGLGYHVSTLVTVASDRLNELVEKLDSVEEVTHG
ncbi:hypothetical protein AAH678_01980 [Sodalis endosymbiont of Spalangia cameroni]|uniref:hypothetical protein n=1 Tax=Sodalis praecaptivus TaxID=1239307 RepID=UPI0031F86F67